MTDFLDVKRREIADRLKELAPLVDEYRRLETAASALAKVGAATPAAATAVKAVRKKPGRPAGGKKAGRPKTKKVGRPAGSTLAGEAHAVRAAPTTGRRRAGRGKGSGTRTAQVLALVHEQPGITIPELATVMDIRHNYLYRVLPALEQEGEIKRVGVAGSRSAGGREPTGWAPTRTEWCPERKEWVPLGTC